MGRRTFFLPQQEADLVNHLTACAALGIHFFAKGIVAGDEEGQYAVQLRWDIDDDSDDLTI